MQFHKANDLKSRNVMSSRMPGCVIGVWWDVCVWMII